MPPKKRSKSSEKARKAKERKLLEARIKTSNEKCEEARGYLEPTGRNSEPNLVKSKTAIDAAMEAYDSNPLVYYLLGQWHRIQEGFDDAVSNYSHSLDLDPTSVRTLEWRAHCYQMLRDFPHAIEDYTSVIGMDPENDHAYNMRGLCVLEGRVPGLKLKSAYFEACTRDFRSAIRLNEANYYAMTNLGKACEDQELLEKALTYYDDALQVNDAYTYARFRRGCTALRLAEKMTLRLKQESELQANEKEAMRTSKQLQTVRSGANPERNHADAPNPSNVTLQDIKEEIREEIVLISERKSTKDLLCRADADFVALLAGNPDANKMAADVTVVVNIGICALLQDNVARAEEYLKYAKEIINQRPQLVEEGVAQPIENVDVVLGVLTIRSNELQQVKEALRAV